MLLIWNSLFDQILYEYMYRKIWRAAFIGNLKNWRLRSTISLSEQLQLDNLLLLLFSLVLFSLLLFSNELELFLEFFKWHIRIRKETERALHFSAGHTAMIGLQLSDFKIRKFVVERRYIFLFWQKGVHFLGGTFHGVLSAMAWSVGSCLQVSQLSQLSEPCLFVLCSFLKSREALESFIVLVTKRLQVWYRYLFLKIYWYLLYLRSTENIKSLFWSVSDVTSISSVTCSMGSSSLDNRSDLSCLSWSHASS